MTEALQRVAQYALDQGLPPWGGSSRQWFVYYRDHFNPDHFKNQ